MKIHRLPPDLANQIAAGEVVERPASVVKELVENALDAGARRIAVAIEQGGKRLVRVVDDGEGMGPEDAVLAVERHATSKIREAADLAAIRTLGFRGEALPSIASVSRFVLRTRARGATEGIEVRVEAGSLLSVSAIGTAEGTVVEVADLFHNLPARRKFLKADSAEAAQVSRLLTQMALAFPEVGFRLDSGGRRVFDWPPVASRDERFFQIYGERPDLVRVWRETAGIRISGHVAAVTDDGPVRGPQHVFVNRRLVRDRTITHAVTAAYGAVTIKERSPEVHLFIEMPHDRLDVNVHPAKAEVRFLDQGHVHESVRLAVADAIGTATATPAWVLSPPVPARAPTPPSPALPGLLGGDRMRSNAEGAARQAPTGPGEGAGIAAVPSGSIPRTDAPRGEAPAAEHEVSSPAAPGLRRMRPLGQFANTYIIAVDEEGLVIVDQHVAHERVLFERMLERLAAGRLPAQRLLAPVIVELAAAERQTLLDHREELERLGIEVEDFGGASLRVGSVPAVLDLADTVATVRALAHDLEGMDRGSPAQAALRRLAATLACHAAVKARMPLTLEKMEHILDELHRTAHSAVCPHGRPVVLRLSRREIEKNFQRI